VITGSSMSRERFIQYKFKNIYRASVDIWRVIYPR
jgi:hypothetical protein